MSVTFDKELITVPFTYTDRDGEEHFGNIYQEPNPPIYQVIFEGEPLEYFNTLEEAQYFVQNHIHEYVEEG